MGTGDKNQFTIKVTFIDEKDQKNLYQFSRQGDQIETEVHKIEDQSQKVPELQGGQQEGAASASGS